MMQWLIVLLLLRNVILPEVLSLPHMGHLQRQSSPDGGKQKLEENTPSHVLLADGDIMKGPTQGPSERFPHFFEFGRDMFLFWDVERSDILFRVLIPVPGNVSLVGLGFSPRGDERDADVVLVTWSDEEVTIMDTTCDESGVLRRDKNQDYDLEYFQFLLEEDNNMLEVVLKRAIDTHDPEDYMIQWGTTRTFLVIGNDKTNDLGTLSFNALTVIEKPLSLMRSDRKLPALSSTDTFSKNFLVEHVRIPDAPTTYWCHIINNNLPDKVHGVKYEPLVTSQGIVHHMELYHCEVPSSRELPSYSGPCENKPPELTPCSKVIAAWATGAGPVIYPEEAGVPLGGPQWSSYLMLEVHYNNPQRLAGLLDNSGIRFTFSESLRQFDVGVLEVGVTYSPNLVIPPGEGDFVWPGLCMSSCTSEGLPPDGIRVFASQLHAHMSGREITTRHYRDGRELPTVDSDPHFTMSFQDIRLLPKDVTVLPGDTLVTTCHFDTTDRENVTMGGYGMMDEMCVNYLHYYPRAELEVCKSTLSEEALDQFFKDTQTFRSNIGAQDNLKTRQTEKMFSSVAWTETNRRLWEQATNVGPFGEECLSSDGKPFHGQREKLNGPAENEITPLDNDIDKGSVLIM